MTLNHDDSEGEGRGSGRPSWLTLPNIMAGGALLIAIGAWMEQSRGSRESIADMKLAASRNEQYIAATYQRKDVAAEQFVRLGEQLLRIERQLTELQLQRRR